jgi:hypothetical protein
MRKATPPQFGVLMPTGKKAASAAAKVMNDPNATDDELSAAASDLAQARKRAPKASPATAKAPSGKGKASRATPKAPSGKGKAPGKR